MNLPHWLFLNSSLGQLDFCFSETQFLTFSLSLWGNPDYSINSFYCCFLKLANLFVLLASKEAWHIELYIYIQCFCFAINGIILHILFCNLIFFTYLHVLEIFSVSILLLTYLILLDLFLGVCVYVSVYVFKN